MLQGQFGDGWPNKVCFWHLGQAIPPSSRLFSAFCPSSPGQKHLFSDWTRNRKQQKIETVQYFKRQFYGTCIKSSFSPQTFDCAAVIFCIYLDLSYKESITLHGPLHVMFLQIDIYGWNCFFVIYPAIKVMISWSVEKIGKYVKYANMSHMHFLLWFFYDHHSEAPVHYVWVAWNKQTQRKPLKHFSQKELPQGRNNLLSRTRHAHIDHLSLFTQ